MMEQAPGIMADQPDMHGSARRLQAAHTRTGCDVHHAPQSGHHQATPAPALRTNIDIWSLIIGPEASNWSRLLVCSHLDSSTRLALFCTCKVARDTVLVTADHATVGVYEDEESEPLDMDSLRAIRAALQTRGKLRTKLEFNFSNASLLGFALGVLEAGTTWLDELKVNQEGEHPGRPTAFLGSVWRCCPNLRVLSLPHALEMPSPDCFPKLEELCVYLGDDNIEVLEGIISSIGPYMAQLTKLSMCPEHRLQQQLHPLPTPLPLLLTPGSVATRLRTLNIHAALDDTGLGLLLQCAPALQELHVPEVRLQSAAQVQMQAPWRVLHTSVLHLSSLALLPSGTDMQITLVRSGDEAPTLVCDTTATEQASAAHLKGVQVRGHCLVIKPPADMPAARQPAALRGCLMACRDLECQAIYLRCWTMTRQLLQELPQLPTRSTQSLLLGADLEWLPHPEPAQLYSTLLPLLPNTFRAIYLSKSPRSIRPTQAQVEGICLGAPATRAPEAPLNIILHGSAPEVVQAIQQKMSEQGGYPNVTVEGC